METFKWICQICQNEMNFSDYRIQPICKECLKKLEEKWKKGD